MSFDPLAAIRVLRDHDVRFVLIGGVAGAVHGSPSVTQDLDFCPEGSPENLTRLATALVKIHARLRGVEEGVPFILDGRTLSAGDHFTFSTDVGDVDCLITPAGTEGYADLSRDAVAVDLDGIEVRIASLDALIRMKRAAGRAKDRAELEILGALRDEIAGTGE
jgi:hypothetical protein